MEGGAPVEDGADAGHEESVSPVEDRVRADGEDVGAVPWNVLAALRLEAVGQLPHQLQGQGVDILSSESRVTTIIILCLFAVFGLDG